MRMSRLESSLLLGSRGPFLRPDDGSGGGGGGAGQDPQPTSGANEGTGKDPEGFRPITSEAELAAYKESLRRNLVAELRKSIKADLDRERQEADDKARRDREAEEAKARGEFEQVENKLKADIEAAQNDAATLRADNDALREAINGFLDAEWQALPQEVRDAYLGAEDDPLAKLRYLPKGKALADKLAAKDPPKRGNGQDPRPNGPAQSNDEGARAASASRYR